MATSPAWTEHALKTLSASGHRSGGARTAVIELLGRQDCCLTAQEIAERLSKQRQSVGMASIYRALDLLDQLKLVQRLETGEGMARFEPALPHGEHHHHMVCERCGNVGAFDDAQLERSIDKLSDQVDFKVTGHEVVLRGYCRDCQDL